jgi:hypothetical protein
MKFEQGELDSLCGVYSLVNADQIINSTAKESPQELFNSIIKYLDKEGMLADILTEGMNFKTIKMILKEVIGERIPNAELPFVGVSNPDLNSFWEEIINFLNSKNRKRAVLLGIGGKHDHWTLIESITEKRIRLLDSIGLKRLDRRYCTTAYECGLRKHVLYPAQTYFLSEE